MNEHHMKQTEAAQILLVNWLGASNALAQYYIRNSEGTLALDCECNAFVGKNGVGKSAEGDGKTPLGELHVRKAFGIEPDPGTALEYLSIDDSIYACDEDCEYYNMIISRNATGHDCTGEHMIDYRDEYAYGLETDFNDANEYPKGSAIFVHCKGLRPWTGGCVALDREMMRRILVTAGSDLLIIISAQASSQCQ